MDNKCKYCGAKTSNEFCDNACEKSYWYWEAHEYRKKHKGEAKAVNVTKYSIGIIIGILIFPLYIAAMVNEYITEKCENTMKYLEIIYYKHRIGGSL